MDADGGSTSESVGGSCISTESSEPRDARVVRELLRSMGIGDGEYEPRVIHRFLDFSYRYVADVLSDAQVYSDHAGKPAIDEDDVRLAIQSKVTSSFSQPPPRQMMLDLAKMRNRIPLPKTIAPPGSIPLPPEQHTLISPNYQLLIPRNQQLPQIEETEEDEAAPAPNLPQTQTNTTDQQQQQQQAPQRVSFPLGAAAKATR